MAILISVLSSLALTWTSLSSCSHRRSSMRSSLPRCLWRSTWASGAVAGTGGVFLLVIRPIVAASNAPLNSIVPRFVISGYPLSSYFRQNVFLFDNPIDSGYPHAKIKVLSKRNPQRRPEMEALIATAIALPIILWLLRSM